MNRSYVKAEKKRRLMLSLALAAICITWLFAGTVLASQTDNPYSSREGQISVTVKDNTVPIPGGSLTIYKVADVVSDNSYWFAYTDAFKNFSTGLTVKYSSSYKPEYIAETIFPDAFTSQSTAAASEAANLNANYDMAADLQAYVANNNVTGQKVQLGTEGAAAGNAVFAKLGAGMYLFLQDEADAPNGYYPVTPFLVTLPGRNAEGAEVWTVDASPKAEALPLGGGNTSLKGEGTPSIRKRVVETSGQKATELENKDLPSGTYFEFKFEAESSSYPMPVNAKGSVKNGGPVVSQSATAMQLRVNGINSIEVGTITFEKEGDYYYTIEELAPANKDFGRDKQVYSLIYHVKKSDDGKKLDVTGEVRDGNANGDLLLEGTNPTLPFTNTYNPEEPDGGNGNTPVTPNRGNNTGGGSGSSGGSSGGSGDKLPQTGQLWWPIWLLITAGVLLIAGGVALKKRGEGKQS